MPSPNYGKIMAKIFGAATDTYSVDQRRKNYEKDRHFATKPVAPRTLKRMTQMHSTKLPNSGYRWKAITSWRQFDAPIQKAGCHFGTKMLGYNYSEKDHWAIN